MIIVYEGCIRLEICTLMTKHPSVSVWQVSSRLREYVVCVQVYTVIE